MGLITGILGLPLAPVRGTIAIAEQVMRQAEEAYYDPATIKRQMEAVEQQRQDGAISEAEAAAWEDELLQRLVEGATRERT